MAVPISCPDPLPRRAAKLRPSRPDGDGQLMTQAIWHRKHHDHTVAHRHAGGNPNVDLVQAGESGSQALGEKENNSSSVGSDLLAGTESVCRRTTSHRPHGPAIAMFDVSPSASLGIRMVSGT